MARRAVCSRPPGPRGRLAHVWVDETRPLLQGARLTAWELGRAGIPHRVITDSSAGALMARGLVDRVVVGADRIAANGDVANKVGTYSLAVLAAHHEHPVSTWPRRCPRSTRPPPRARRSRSRSATRRRFWARRPGGVRRAQPGLRRDPGRAGGRRDHRGRGAAGALPGGDRAGGRLMDAERLLSEARRPLCIGIGGGGDVVGALATAEACRLYAGARPVLGGVTWERRPIDPLPGPRGAAEIADAEELGPRVLLAASAATRVRVERRALRRGADGRVPRRAHGAGGREPRRADRGPRARAGGGAPGVRPARARGRGRRRARPRPRARPGEPALRRGDAGRRRAARRGGLRAGARRACSASAATASSPPRRCSSASRRWRRAGGLAGVRGLTEPVVERLDAAVAAVPTEASAQALRCFRGELGETTIRAGRRSVQLSPVGAMHRLPRPRRGRGLGRQARRSRCASAPTSRRPTRR